MHSSLKICSRKVVILKNIAIKLFSPTWNSHFHRARLSSHHSYLASLILTWRWSRQWSNPDSRGMQQGYSTWSLHNTPVNSMFFMPAPSRFARCLKQKLVLNLHGKQSNVSTTIFLDSLPRSSNIERGSVYQSSEYDIKTFHTKKIQQVYSLLEAETCAKFTWEAE